MTLLMDAETEARKATLEARWVGKRVRHQPGNPAKPAVTGVVAAIKYVELRDARDGTTRRDLTADLAPDSGGRCVPVSIAQLEAAEAL